MICHEYFTTWAKSQEQQEEENNFQTLRTAAFASRSKIYYLSYQRLEIWKSDIWKFEKKLSNLHHCAICPCTVSSLHPRFYPFLASPVTSELSESFGRISDTFHCSHRLNFAFLATTKFLWRSQFDKDLVAKLHFRSQQIEVDSLKNWHISQMPRIPIVDVWPQVRKIQDLQGKKIDRSSIFVAFLGTPSLTSNYRSRWSNTTQLLPLLTAKLQFWSTWDVFFKEKYAVEVHVL